ESAVSDASGQSDKEAENQDDGYELDSEEPPSEVSDACEGSEEEAEEAAPASSDPEPSSPEASDDEASASSASEDEEPELPPPSKKGKHTRDERVTPRKLESQEKHKKKDKKNDKARGTESGKEKKQRQSSPKRKAAEDPRGPQKPKKKQRQSSPERKAAEDPKGKSRNKHGAQAGGSGTALSEAEQKLKAINSNSHHTEYLRFGRWTSNRKRFPKVLKDCLANESSRMKLFEEYVAAKGDVNQIIMKHEQQLREAQRSQIRYGFRGEKWVRDTHGDTKGEKIMETIADPECPEDSLYFVFVEINIDDVREIQRITKLELAGQLDEEMLKAFTEAGGILDSSKQLALGNGVSSDTVGKALKMMGGGAPATGAAKAKPSKGKAEPSKAAKVGQQRKFKLT
ncbi:unnamed protein product, partial [Symbiodinium necroappetens]